jgi:protein involved in polysaccharide export with SLBB domain
VGEGAAPPLPSPPPVAATAYRLGPGDKVRIETFGETALTGEFALDGEGKIAFPLLGTIKASERSADELGTEIQTRLAAQALRDPKVTVQVIGFRPVYVLGEVARPGEFPFASDLSVFALVAKAGGFTYRANRKRVYIRHAAAPDEVAYKLDAATPVRPGDTVRIGDRVF